MRLLFLLLIFPSFAFAELTYTKDAKPIFSKNCAQCHSGNSKLPNLLDYDIAFKYRFSIKQKMDDRTMPHIGSITESERDVLRAWVDQGAKE